MALGDRLRAAREEAGLTQLDLVVELRRRFPDDFRRTSDKRVSEWENSRVSGVAFHVVAAVGAVTGKPLSFFVDADRTDEAASRPPRGSGASAPAAERQAEVQELLERRLAEVESENAEMRRQLEELGEDAPAPPSPRQAEG